MFEAHLIQGVERLAEAELLDLPEERDDVAVLEAAETVERVRLGVHGKRRIAVVVEGTAAHQLVAVPFKPDVLADHARNRNLVLDAAHALTSDLIEATGWQVHSVRAALTGFRKDGKELIRAKDEGGVTRYRVAAEA